MPGGVWVLEDAIRASAERSEVCRVAVFEERVEERLLREVISALRFVSALRRAAFWAASEVRDLSVSARECWRWLWRDLARVWSKASFSGLGGTGGTGRGSVGCGGRSNGDERRSTGGAWSFGWTGGVEYAGCVA
jgi:hypothetical protein